MFSPGIMKKSLQEFCGNLKNKEECRFYDVFVIYLGILILLR